MFLIFIFSLSIICSNAQNISSIEDEEIETTTLCDLSELQIDKFQLTTFVNNYAESAIVSSDDNQNIIYLPKKLYDTSLYLLGAQKFSDIYYGVACTATYPDLIFTILGRELHIPQKHYVDQRTRDSNLCRVLLDYKADDQSYEFPRRFQTNICRLLS